MSVFKLYYYELKKNKNLFIIVFIISFLIMIYNILFSIHSTNNEYEILKNFNSSKLLPHRFSEYVSISGIDKLNINVGIYVNLSLMMMTLVLISILFSIIIATRGYSKKNKSCFTEIFLPTKMYEIKVAKIMTGLSLYIYASILSFIIVIVGNIAVKLYFGNMLNLSVFTLNTPVLLDMFLPIGIKSTLSITFIFALTCVIGVQSLSSLFLTNIQNDINIRNRLIFVVFLVISFIIMSSYLLMLMLEISFYAPIYSFAYLNINDIFKIFFILLSIVLFFVDIIVSKKRLRGGM